MTSRVPRRAAAVLTVALAAPGLAACGSGPISTDAKPVPVAFDQRGLPDEVSIGVIVSLSSEPGEGAQWNQAAEGAEVAAYRFGKGGTRVTVVPVNDNGTATGARTAVQTLAKQDVAGIVLATSGPHVKAALAAAKAADLPVVAPYPVGGPDLADTAWATGPDIAQTDAALGRALEQRKVSDPVVIDAGGSVPDQVTAAETLTFGVGQDPDRVALAVRKADRAKGADVDGVVIVGSADLQGPLVAALQGADLDLPVFLSPDALSPQFATSLAKAGGSLDADLTTVGTADGDTTAMQPGSAGASAAAFFAALRAASGDPKVQDFFDGEPFRTVAAYADTRSHDAVVALVDAAGKAGSTEPAKVGAELDKLRLDDGNGLAGPALDLTSRTALDDGAITALQATTQDPGLRPTGPEDQLFWFTAPGS